MKYILFAGNTYYPNGGWKDFRGLFDTVDLAIKAVNDYNENKHNLEDDWDWWHVVNALSLEVDAGTLEPYEEYKE